jgi:hypothetical protein
MINKKLLLLILLFPLSIYGESFQHLKKEHQAPYSGFLFSPEALAKVTVEKKKDVEMCKVEKEHIEETCKIQTDTTSQLCERRLKLMDDTYKIALAEKDHKITELQKQVGNKTWYLVGGIVIGTVTAGTIVYILK